MTKPKWQTNPSVLKLALDASQESRLSDFEPMTPCYESIMEARGYVRVDGKWVPPDPANELSGMKMRPRLMGSCG